MGAEQDPIQNSVVPTFYLVLRWLAQSGSFILIQALSLFISSGHWGWGMAWFYLVLFAANQVLVGMMLIPRNPELVLERTQMDRRSARPWDRLLVGVSTLFGPICTWIVAGLDLRFSWSAPLFLDSWWAYLPACLTATALVVRTALEDRTLKKELEGYEDYSGRVPYRLLPGL